jgi:hypothetical protein
MAIQKIRQAITQEQIILREASVANIREKLILRYPHNADTLKILHPYALRRYRKALEHGVLDPKKLRMHHCSNAIAIDYAIDRRDSNGVPDHEWYLEFKSGWFYDKRAPQTRSGQLRKVKKIFARDKEVRALAKRVASQ